MRTPASLNTSAAAAGAGAASSARAAQSASTAGAAAKDDGLILGFAAFAYTLLLPYFYHNSLISREGEAAIAAILAATLALLAWRAAARSSYVTWRPWSVAAYQLASATVLTANLQLQLDVPPTPGALGCLADCLRMLTGCRCHIPLFLGAGLPLDLLPQMVVSALSVGGVIALRSDCLTPLMDSQLMDERVGLLHDILSVPLLGLLPGWLPGNCHVRCSGLLNFFLVLFGWLVPVYLVARKEWLATGDTGEPPAAAVATRGGFGPGRCRPISQRLAAWLSRHVFFAGGPVEAKVHAWVCLTVFCWLAGGLLALAGMG